MRSTKLMLGTMILGLGITGAAWAQPAPNHGRDAAMYSRYDTGWDDANHARGNQDEWRWDRGDVSHGWYNPYAYWRGDGDHDRDDRNPRKAYGDRDDRNHWRGDRDARRPWNWGHSDMRRGKKNDR